MVTMRSPQGHKLYYTALQNLHIKHFGEGYTDFRELSAHGSDRFIVRLVSSHGSCIGIVNPHIDENRAFLGFGKTFRDSGLKVPEILTVAKDNGSYLLEDLGDETLAARVNSDWVNGAEEKMYLYKQVIEILPRFQVETADKINYSLCYQFGEFGAENIDYDINYFRRRFFDIFYKSPIDENSLNRELELLKQKLLELPRKYFLYRDFQARNIMIKNGELYFIDFQSGRQGALLYDIASLLWQAKAKIPNPLRDVLLDYYLDTVTEYTKINKHQYRDYFPYFAMIRILQTLGAYGYVGIVKGKTSFTESIPLAIENMLLILNEKVSHNEFGYLRRMFEELRKSDLA